MADIFRTIKNKNYTVMSNHHLQNPKDSFSSGRLAVQRERAGCLL